MQTYGNREVRIFLTEVVDRGDFDGDCPAPEDIGQWRRALQQIVEAITVMTTVDEFGAQPVGSIDVDLLTTDLYMLRYGCAAAETILQAVRRVRRCMECGRNLLLEPSYIGVCNDCERTIEHDEHSHEAH